MSFEVIPAIDIAGGRLGRMTADGPVRVKSAFDGDPLAAAEAFLAAGARWLHVVDMDLAFSGKAANLSVVERIAGLPALVQASGGVTTERDVDLLLEAGAARVVLGSGALSDRAGVVRLAAGLGERLALGVEIRGDRIRPRGRDASVDLPLDDTLGFLATSGARRLIVTSLERVSALSGPDLPAAGRVARTTGLPVIAAGGIASLEDLCGLAGMPSVEGAIVGRAALEGGLDLHAAIALR